MGVLALWYFAQKNLRRRKLRTLLSIIGILISSILVVTLLLIMDGFSESMTTSLNTWGSNNIIVQQKGTADQSLSLINASLEDQLLHSPELSGLIACTSPEVWVIITDPETTIGYNMLLGIIPSKETQTTGLVEGNLIRGEYFEDDENRKIVIGHTIAIDLEVGVGDTKEILGMNFTITGIFATGSFFDYFMLISIDDARTIRGFSKDQLSDLQVKPVDLDAGKKIKEYINTHFTDLEAINIEALASQAEDMFFMVKAITIAVSAVTMIIGAVGVFNTMLMSVIERRAEIAVLKATGWSNKEIALEVIFESLTIGIVASLFGIVLGILLAYLISRSINGLVIALKLTSILIAFSFGAGLSVLGGIYPAIRAMRVDPVTDLRGE